MKQIILSFITFISFSTAWSASCGYFLDGKPNTFDVPPGESLAIIFDSQMKEVFRGDRSEAKSYLDSHSLEGFKATVSIKYWPKTPDVSAITIYRVTPVAGGKSKIVTQYGASTTVMGDAWMVLGYSFSNDNVFDIRCN